jgi:hypothetical protein
VGHWALIEINPPTNFVSRNIAMTFGVGSDTHQEITTSGFAKDCGQEFTPFSNFVEDTQCEQIGMIFGFPKRI